VTLSVNSEIIIALQNSY